MSVDRLVVGAGVFGLHATERLLTRGMTVALVDLEPRPLMRASLVNQARLHNGYHYPRSLYTALGSARSMQRFIDDFPAAVNNGFTKIYAIAAAGSSTDAEQFERFCARVGVPARRVDVRDHFDPAVVTAAYQTQEYSLDAPELRRTLLERIARHADRLVRLMPDQPVAAKAFGGGWRIRLASGADVRAGGVINATYAGTNGVLRVFGQPPLRLKYELCEVALVKAPALVGVGLTLMDGPFFSVMPFGHSGLHTLTSVEHTPRRTGEEGDLPRFACQPARVGCEPLALANCGTCPVRPPTGFPLMRALARRFVPDFEAEHVDSLFAVKTVLATSEVDDTRPTLVIRHDAPAPLLTVFSGKINTVYDVEEAL